MPEWLSLPTSDHKVPGSNPSWRQWSGVAKVSCILHHWGVQLILAYSWARPAILIAGKGRGGIFFISSVSSISFLFLFLPCPSLSSFLLSLLSLLPFSGRWHKMTHKGWHIIKPQHNQNRIPLEAEFSSWLYISSLHRAFHYLPFIVSIWFK